MDLAVTTRVRIRAIQASDAEACGRAAFQAHRCVAEMNNFPPEHPNVDFSVGMMRAKIADPRARGWVAERDGQVVGSVFLNDFGAVSAIGPMTVHPSHEGGTGRALMEAALEEARSRGTASVRLVQSPAHLRSLALYMRLGFEAREPLALVRAEPRADTLASASRNAGADDAEACNALCDRVHGFARAAEVQRAIGERSAQVLERDGRIVAYATALGFRGHAVAETTADLVALISHMPLSPGPGFFLPLRNGDLVRWALGSRLKLQWPATLMTLGAYEEPKGAFLPSIAF